MKCSHLAKQNENLSITVLISLYYINILTIDEENNGTILIWKNYSNLMIMRYNYILFGKKDYV